MPEAIVMDEKSKIIVVFSGSALSAPPLSQEPPSTWNSPLVVLNTTLELGASAPRAPDGLNGDGLYRLSKSSTHNGLALRNGLRLAERFCALIQLRHNDTNMR